MATNTIPDKVLESLEYMPGYFRAELEPHGTLDQQHPVVSLLQAFEANLHLAERMAEESGMLFDPLALADFRRIVAPSGKVRAPGIDQWERQQLNWLASWLAIDLDQDWLSEHDNQPSSVPDPAPDGHPAERFAKARDVIRKIGPLYHQLGTPGGLRGMISLFFDVDVDILEHSWLGGMQVGYRSTIGVDTLLIERPDAERDFVVLVKRKDEAATGINMPELAIPCVLEGAAAGREAVCFSPGSQAADESNPGPRERQNSFITKLLSLIEQQEPAHTRAYLAFDVNPVAESKPRKISGLVIGENSVIGDFYID